MKKLLLTGLILSYIGAFAQQSSISKAKALKYINPAFLKTSVRVPSPGERNRDNGMPLNQISIPHSKRSSVQATANETTIGNTYYDLQTNNGISNRLVNNADGTMSAVWTFSPDPTAGYPNRGTGYNYFNDSTWQAIPTSRIEEGYRAGFPNIGVTSTGLEVDIAHGIQTDGSSRGMLLTTRQNKGTGAWGTNTDILGLEPADTIDLWSKMVAGAGSDGQSIHAIWRGGTSGVVDGQSAPIFYSRSTDNGVSWDKLETIIPEIDSSFYQGFSADEYSIDARGNTVAIVAGSLTEDVVLLKSIDNGNSWTKTIVNSFPIPFFNSTTMSTNPDPPYTGVGDTLWSGSGDPTVVIDNNYEVHVFFTQFPVIESAVNSGLNYFPNSTELFYWNESMSTDSAVFIAYAPDLNGNGQIDIPSTDAGACPNDYFPYGKYGLARIIEEPSAGVDANNNLYVCYQTVDELSNAGDVASFNNKVFKHPYIIKSTDDGNTWTDFNAAFDVVRATQSDNSDDEEGVFASMAKLVDTKVHVIYQRDGAPGVSLATEGTCDWSNNTNDGTSLPLSDIIYVGLDTSLTVGIPELAASSYGVILSANFPNPATTYTQFNVTLNKALNIKVDVEDMLGQNVYSENKGKLSVGVHTVTLNTSYLSSGVYFYTVTAGDEKLTGKMIVK